LPKRRGRNEDPVGKRAKAARAAQTKATKKAKLEDKEKRVAEADAAKETLAEMEVNKSFIQMQEDQQRIRRLSDMESMTDSEITDGLEDEVAESDDSDESRESIDEGPEAESESLAGDEMEQSKKRTSKVSFGLMIFTYNCSTVTVTSRETRRLYQS
jgi:hypothetical protein